MVRNIEVVEACGRSIEDLPVEIVERKGIGHPDTLCDGIAEGISRAYTLWCDDHLGQRLHHNFDKVQLVAGEANIDFGGGEILKPIRVQIAGRAMPTWKGQRIPVDMIARDAAREYLRRTVPRLDVDRFAIIECFAGEGDPALIDTTREEEITANDTSFGCSHWPLSGLERVVYETCRHINTSLINEFPIGEDIKVMGLRREGRITLTCSVPFRALEIPDRAQYDNHKGRLREAILQFARQIEERTAESDLNCADTEGNRVFLTLSGTGAEHADDGCVGRGNRVNGLITPFRSTSLEAAAGKNPISHVGKIYNVLALEIAKGVIEGVSEVADATVHILSRIGKPLDEPLVASVTVRMKHGEVTDSAREAVRGIVDAQLADVDRISTLVLEEKVSLY